jgi:hypothetical protein
LFLKRINNELTRRSVLRTGIDKAQQSLCLFTSVLRLVIMPPPSTEQSFHANLSQFRWARGANDDTQQQQTTQPGNPFSRFYNAVAGDYIPLRSNEQSNEDEAWFALSRWERWGFRVNSVVRLCSIETFLGC